MSKLRCHPDSNRGNGGFADLKGLNRLAEAAAESLADSTAADTTHNREQGAMEQRLAPRPTIAALFVEPPPRGAYADLPGVDLWPLERDARTYAGPHPVVAHPPCSRWCRLAGLVEARWGHKRGEDGGCFAAALLAVRSWGGVLEHPAYSDAWPAHDLPEPPRHGWQRGICGGWVTHVEQGRYGHPAKKATWLYAFGVSYLPTMEWGISADFASNALVSWCGNRVRSGETRPRVGKRAADRTPAAFRDLLLSIARGAGAGAPHSWPWSAGVRSTAC